MKVVLYSASGQVNCRILAEVQSRDHDVTAVFRNPESLSPGVESRCDDLDQRRPNS
jgi:putative NADH-flavin reductase